VTERLRARGNGDLMNVDELRVFMGCRALCRNKTFIMRSDWYIDGVFWCIKGIVIHREVSTRAGEVEGRHWKEPSPENPGTLAD